MAHRNKKDKTGKCYTRGKKAEKLYEDILKSRDIESEEVKGKRQWVDHIDFLLTHPDGSEESVEVKARKKSSRSDDKVQDEWIWIEFKNVQGKDGWLYGKADRIAFQVEEGFVMIDRKKLVKLAEKLIDLEDIVKKSSDAQYKGYRRWNRPKELVGMLKMDDIKSLDHELWEH